MSANLPLMSPIVQRLRAKYTKHHTRIPKDEESSNILELASMDSKSKRAHLNNATSTAAPDTAVLTSVEATGDQGSVHDFGLPDNRILVEMDVEQNVTGL